MGHDVRNYIGVDKREIGRRIRALLPDYMPMGSAGMAEMGEMEMPLPDNTLPMMTGQGPFGPIEMGGMFTVMKVRAGLADGNFRDPGWCKHTPGTVAYELTGAPAPVARRRPAPDGPAPSTLRAVRGRRTHSDH